MALACGIDLPISGIEGQHFSCLSDDDSGDATDPSGDHRRRPGRLAPVPYAHSDDADQPFQRIPISHSDRSRSVWCGVSAPLDAFLFQCSVVASSTVEPVPVVNRRDPRATRSDPPSQTQRRAREVPVDPRGRAVGHGGHFLIPFVGLVDKALALSAAFAGAVASAASGFRIDGPSSANR
jgi:hypothetical protein